MRAALCVWLDHNFVSAAGEKHQCGVARSGKTRERVAPRHDINKQEYYLGRLHKYHLVHSPRHTGGVACLCLLKFDLASKERVLFAGVCVWHFHRAPKHAHTFTARTTRHTFHCTDKSANLFALALSCALISAEIYTQAHILETKKK